MKKKPFCCFCSTDLISLPENIEVTSKPWPHAEPNFMWCVECKIVHNVMQGLSEHCLKYRIKKPSDIKTKSIANIEIIGENQEAVDAVHDMIKKKESK